MSKKFRIFSIIGACLGLWLLAGCATGSLEERSDVSYKSAPIDKENPAGPRVGFASGEVKGGPFKPNLLLGQFILDNGKKPQMQSQRTTSLTAPPALPSRPVKSDEILSKPPKKSPRGDKKAAIIPEQPPLCPPQEQVQVIVVDETTWFPRFAPMGFTGATFEGWLIGWVRSLLSNAPNAFIGAFAPGTNIKMNQQANPQANADAAAAAAASAAAAAAAGK